MLIDYPQFEGIAQYLRQSLGSMGLIDTEAAFTYTPEHEASLGEKNDGFGTAFVHIAFKDSICSTAFYEVFQSFDLSYQFKGSILCALDLAISVDHPLNDPAKLAQACQTLADNLGVQFRPPAGAASVLGSITAMNQALTSVDNVVENNLLSQVCTIM